MEVIRYLSPQVDAAHGARVSCPDTLVLCIVHPTLRALDLSDSPHLQELDLRGLTGTDEVHLTVQGCPALRHVRMPESARAVVHLDGGDQTPEMLIEAQLALLDACWRQAKFMLDAADHRHPPWQSARIGPAHAPDETPQPVELRVLTGASSRAGGHLVLEPNVSWRTALVIDHPDLRSLSCAQALSHLRISQTPSLERLSLQASMGHVELIGCNRLLCLDGLGSANRLELGHQTGARAGLVIALPAQQVDLSDSHVTALTLHEPTTLTIENCLQLMRTSLGVGTKVNCTGHVPPDLVEVSEVHLNDGTFRRLQQACIAGDQSSWEQFQGLLKHCTQALLPGVLATLLEMLRAGIDPAVVWAHRCRLARRLMRDQNGRPVTDPYAWRWAMALDLGADGWRADWLLWQGCRHLPEARAAMHQMVVDLCYQTHILEQMVSWWQHTGQAAVAMPEFLTAMFVHARTHRPMPLQTREWLTRTAKSLMRTPQMDAGLRRAAHDFLLKHLPRCHVLETLAEQITARPVEVRCALVRLLTDPPKQAGSSLSESEFRQLAQLLILSGRLPPGFRAAPKNDTTFDPPPWSTADHGCTTPLLR
ncbi:hypothetical protein [Sphaerotilus sp.]|uniref:hypothetical protein n=1 Tax=Sphaerotilus sp. TaxID=2093942 RepID=UPI002ACDC621|nr:hypothetical protein [Sphaerotilus sp.]MDZ7855083.1 hypothetical protein [Sphaerotilus sp.]